MNYLTVNLCGGLGNQLWQVAAADTIAKQSKKLLVFRTCVSPVTHHSSTNYFSGLLSSWAQEAPTKAFEYAIIVKETSYRYYDDWASLPDFASVILEGYFQNYQYISMNFSGRLALPSPPLSIPHKTAFIHVRGGDYVNHWLHDVGLNTRSAYYINAINQFPSDTTFLLFTNDRLYAEKASWLSSVAERIQWAPDSWSELECLATMAACPLGGICSNSTFAWWAAWIGKASEKHHILPNRWFNDPSIFVEGYFFPEATILYV